MTTARRTRALATAALLLAAVTGCADDAPQAKPTESPSSSASSPTPTQTKRPTDSEVAADRASQVVRDYFSAVDLLRQQPNRPLKKLKSVAISTQLAAQENLMRNQRSAGHRQLGNTEIAALKVQSVNLNNANPEAGQVPTVQVDVCWDVSQVDVVDSSGSSVLSRDRKLRAWTRYLVANYEWETNPDRGWRVAGGEDLERSPCGAS